MANCRAADRSFLPRAFPLLALAVAMGGMGVPEVRATDDTKIETQTCTLEPGPVRTVARVLDSETVVLDDASEVRLIGALAPRARDSGAAAGTWPAEQDAIAVLSELVLGRSVKLAYGDRRTDRYGRHVAHLFVEKDGESQWVAGALLSQGHARAYGLQENFACARELLANEQIAREGRRGIWAIALYRPKPASLSGALMALRNSFQIVEGRVANVSRTKSTVYLNFGKDWKTDFTIRVGKAVLSANAAWSAGLEGLEGKTIAVRGWIERRNGPLIDIIDPSQIDIPAEQPAPPAATKPAESGTDPEPETASAPTKPSDGAAAAPSPSGAMPPATRHKQKRPEPRAPGAVNL